MKRRLLRPGLTGGLMLLTLALGGCAQPPSTLVSCVFLSSSLPITADVKDTKPTKVAIFNANTAYTAVCAY